MTHTPIKFIYFDVGMVLDIYPRTVKEEPQDSPAWQLDFTNELITCDQILCTGEMSLLNLWHSFCDRTSYPPSLISDPVDYICRRHHPRTPMHLFVDQIRERYKVGLLTNMYSQLLPRLVDAGNIPPLDWFSAVVDSSVVGIGKPNRKIFEIARRHAGVDHAEIGFVDDRLDNVEAARDYGWTAWQFDVDHPEVTIQTIAKALLE